MDGKDGYSGWKRRFFKLKKDSLEWYSNAWPNAPMKNSLLLTGTKFEHSGCMITISGPHMNRVMCLKAPTVHDADIWMRHFEHPSRTGKQVTFGGVQSDASMGPLQTCIAAPGTGVVVGNSGLVVRENFDLQSREVALLAKGAQVNIAEIRGRRAHITGVGWASVSTADGVPLIAPAVNATAAAPNPINTSFAGVASTQHASPSFAGVPHVQSVVGPPGFSPAASPQPPSSRSLPHHLSVTIPQGPPIQSAPAGSSDFTPSTTAPPMYQGWLQKETDYAGYKNRYFKLFPSTLHYYSDAGAHDFKGTIHLTGTRIGQMGSNIVIKANKNSRNQKKVVLKAGSEEEATTWVAVLQKSRQSTGSDRANTGWTGADSGLLGPSSPTSVYSAAYSSPRVTAKPTPGLIHSGWLEKESSWSGYKRRFFKLLPRQLLYFEDKMETNLKGTVPLGPGVQFSRQGPKIILTGIRETAVVLRAASEAEAQTWVTMLYQARDSVDAVVVN